MGLLWLAMVGSRGGERGRRWSGHWHRNERVNYAVRDARLSVDIVVNRGKGGGGGEHPGACKVKLSFDHSFDRCFLQVRVKWDDECCTQLSVLSIAGEVGRRRVYGFGYSDQRPVD